MGATVVAASVTVVQGIVGHVEQSVMVGVSFVVTVVGVSFAVTVGVSFVVIVGCSLVVMVTGACVAQSHSGATVVAGSVTAMQGIVGHVEQSAPPVTVVRGSVGHVTLGQLLSVVSVTGTCVGQSHLGAIVVAASVVAGSVGLSSVVMVGV